MDEESEGSDSSESDSSESSEVDEAIPTPSEKRAPPEELSSPELSSPERDAIKCLKLQPAPSPPGDIPQNMPTAPAEASPIAPVYGHTGWAVSQAGFREMKGIYHRVVAQECTGRPFWEHGLQWKPLCATRLTTARIFLQEPEGEQWHKCSKC